MQNLQNSFGMPSSTSAHLGASLAAAALLLTTVAQPAAAAIVMTATEIGGDVVFSYRGTLDLAGMTQGGQTGMNASRVWASSSAVQFRTAGPITNNNFQYGLAFSSRPGNLGPGTVLYAATTASGTTATFGTLGTNLYLEKDKLASAWLNTQSGSMTFQGQTLAGLGIAPGTYTWVLSGTAADTITLNAVPEPSSLALFGAGGLACAFVSCRRRLMGKR